MVGFGFFQSRSNAAESAEPVDLPSGAAVGQHNDGTLKVPSDQTPPTWLSVRGLRAPFLIGVSTANNTATPASSTTAAPSAPWSELSFALDKGDVLLVRGDSGSGKTTLLKCIADLLPYEHGVVEFAGQSRVLYVPQRPAVQPGTPQDFLRTIEGFASNRNEAPIPAPRPSHTSLRHRTSSEIRWQESAAGFATNGTRDDEENRAASAVSLAGEGGSSVLGFEEATRGPGWMLEGAETVLNAKTAGLGLASETSPASAASQIPTTPRKESSSLISKVGSPRGRELPNSPRPASIGSISGLSSSTTTIPGDAIFLSAAFWSVPTEVWDREWAQISGGEAQRVALAIATSLIGGRRKSEGVLLLDEPTSALDNRIAIAVEQTLLLASPPLTLIWITHSDEQARRIVNLVDRDNTRTQEKWRNRTRSVSRGAGVRAGSNASTERTPLVVGESQRKDESAHAAPKERKVRILKLSRRIS